MDYIQRAVTPRIEQAHKHYPVITVTGPRQAGKSTLCRHMFAEYKYVNLERIAMRSMAAADPQGFLESLGNHVIIDEVQHVPQLLSEIQVMVDEDRDRRFILTGSSNFALLNAVSQSLAGRCALFTLPPFSFAEMTADMKEPDIDTIMLRGFYPGVLVNGIPPKDFYDNYYNTYVERDLRDLLKVSNLLKFDKFVRLLALRTGSEFNASALSRDAGVSAITISEWLSLLATSYIVFELPPYYTNQGKSLTKNRKIYFYDTGLLCSLLNISSSSDLAGHPLRGQIFENLAVSSLMKTELAGTNRPNLYFYRENQGLEIDIVKPTSAGGLDLYEIKSGKTLQPEYAANMKKLAAQLSIPSKSTIIYNGESFPPSVLNVRDI